MRLQQECLYCQKQINGITDKNIVIYTVRVRTNIREQRSNPNAFITK